MRFDLLTVTDWKLRKLYSWQPEAIKILDGPQCPNCKCNHTVTYHLPGNKHASQMSLWPDAKEQCGFFCPGCSFTGASYRLPAQADEEYIDGMIFQET